MVPAGAVHDWRGGQHCGLHRMRRKHIPKQHCIYWHQLHGMRCWDVDKRCDGPSKLHLSAQPAAESAKPAKSAAAIAATASISAATKPTASVSAAFSAASFAATAVAAAPVTSASAAASSAAATAATTR